MARLLTVVAAACLVLAAGVSVAAPLPEDADRPAYFHPTAVGTRWVYHCKRIIGSEDDTEVITAVKWRGREAYVSIAGDRNRKLTPFRTMWVKADGVYCVDYGDGKKFDWPRCHIRTPLRPGTAWEACWPEAKWLWTARAVEEVVIPAGKFRAVRVEVLFRGMDSKLFRGTEWYVEGIGRVKSTNDVGETVEVLKSFTTGKD